MSETDGEQIDESGTYRALGFTVRNLNRELTLGLQRRIAPEGVSVAMSIFLRCLWERDGLTQRELASDAQLVEGATATILGQMETAGLVVRLRNPEDRRKVNIYLTQPARRLYLRLKATHEELDGRARQGVSEEDYETFLRVAAKMTGNLAATRSPDDRSRDLTGADPDALGPATVPGRGPD
ncbi:MarR family winged helix-turn-helix transcriptional regulator [Salipiger abyssi]|uniref:MarR family winged helix-turn-helix transcriptional regulator n=1 Tax=Salipiger abyssi TaxID=1250539 RepID=UPI001A8D9002|nr:MarR family transcriptional regulator [Salipiger abyssi]MBN9887198.1 MarR family transcriptional regulator [Salipiger abyssi]